MRPQTRGTRDRPLGMPAIFMGLLGPSHKGSVRKTYPPRSRSWKGLTGLVRLEAARAASANARIASWNHTKPQFPWQTTISRGVPPRGVRHLMRGEAATSNHRGWSIRSRLESSSQDCGGLLGVAGMGRGQEAGPG
jgi:hypothetical protein